MEVEDLKKQREKTEAEKQVDLMKYEIINELGLLEKVRSMGWKSLTAKETGRIGGLITKKKKMMQSETSSNIQEPGV